MQLDGWHLLFEECLLDLTYLYNLNVTKTSKSRLDTIGLHVCMIWLLYKSYADLRGAIIHLGCQKTQCIFCCFFCSFFQIRGLLQAFVWKHTFKFLLNHWMEFWKPWAGHSWQFELQDWKLHVSNSSDREFSSKKDLQKTEHEAVKTSSQWLCEHYQQNCRVWIPCCMLFFYSYGSFWYKLSQSRWK